MINESNNQPYPFMPLIKEFQNIWREIRIAKEEYKRIMVGRKILGKSLYLGKIDRV